MSGSNSKLMRLVAKATLDSVIFCFYCDYEPLEPDFETCPECGKRNKLKEVGLI